MICSSLFHQFPFHRDKMGQDSLASRHVSKFTEAFVPLRSVETCVNNNLNTGSQSVNESFVMPRYTPDQAMFLPVTLRINLVTGVDIQDNNNNNNNNNNNKPLFRFSLSTFLSSGRCQFQFISCWLKSCLQESLRIIIKVTEPKITHSRIRDLVLTDRGCVTLTKWCSRWNRQKHATKVDHIFLTA